MRSIVACASLLASFATAQSFPNFESPQTNPLAVSADGTRLLAANTPDNRIAVFSLANPDRPSLVREIPVGLEPVSVRFRTMAEAWVVNHLSDSVSIVDLQSGLVIETLQVDDEPSDVVFAAGRAFVTTATRRRVQAFDVSTRAQIGSVDLFCDEPRWAEVSADGSTLYVAAHKSGNDTTTVPEHLAPPQPAPSNPALPPGPSVGLLVDSEDPTWSAQHGIVLPDYDVFEIDTTSLAVTTRHTGVGTILFGMAVHPINGSVWVANTEALNLTRFEPALRGHMVDHRVTEISSGGNIQPHDLNAGINYATLPNPSALNSALAQPTDVAFAPSGGSLFVAAFGTDRIGVVNAAGAVTARIAVGNATSSRDMRGPRGLAHHPTAARLYVLNRLSNTLSIVDTVAQSETRELPLVYDPTPAHLKEGRGFLYDAKLSGNGTGSCAVCHIDGKTDNMGWDLGDPGGSMMTVFNPTPLQLHPMKGPMITQTLLGIVGMNPLHWRGDRADFAAFNPAFDGLLGGAEISNADMAAFTGFVNSLVFPPNPNLNRDRSLPTTPAGESAADGRTAFLNRTFNGSTRCNDCHRLPTGSNNLTIPGPILGEPQAFKVPHLRNIYKRDGRKDIGGMRTSGYGQLHDGTDDDVFDLLSRTVFGPLATQPSNKRRLQRFVEAIDTGTAPTVGFSLTFDANNYQDPDLTVPRIVLIQRATVNDCDLVVRGQIDGIERGYLFNRANQDFDPDRAGDPSMSVLQFDQLIAQSRAVLTFMGVPRGQGARIGRDRDSDGTLDGDEAAAPYGSTTPGCNLKIRANSPAFRGNSVFGIVTEDATPGAAGALFVGFGQSSIPFFGIDILVDPIGLTAISQVADAHGTAVTDIAISDSPGNAGLTFYVQSVFLDGCGPQGIGATNGLVISVD